MDSPNYKSPFSATELRPGTQALDPASSGTFGFGIGIFAAYPD